MSTHPAGDNCSGWTSTSCACAVKDQADLIAISDANRTDITWSAAEEMEKTHVVYVSGNMLPLFGFEPVFGRRSR